MPTILFNLDWMIWNVFLAIIPVLLGYFFKYARIYIGRIIFFLLWLLFLPNTIYLVTDIIHLQEDLLMVTGIYDLMIFLMYSSLIIIGIVTYFLSLLFVVGKPVKKRTTYFFQMGVIHFLVGLGIILGRVYRFNSWDIVSQPKEILIISSSILSSTNYFIYIVLFTAGMLLLQYGVSYLIGKGK